MKRTVLAWVGGLLLVGGLLPTRYADAANESFSDFMKRERGEFESFKSGKKVEAPPTKATADGILFQVAEPSEESAQRRRATELYDEYCRIQGILNDPDPKKGYDARIRELRGRLFRTDRPGYDQALWGEKDWYESWPLLQDLEARAAGHRAELQRLADTWRTEGFESIFYLPLNECYGKKFPYSYLDRKDQSVFPSPIKTHMVDYVRYQMDQLWPVNAPAPETPPPSTPPRVVHEDPPPPEPEPPAIDPIDEDVREENVPPVKPWDEMTPEERRRALMENSPEAWAGFQRDILGSDTNGHARAEAVVTCSNVTAVATNIAIANLPPPIPVPVVKPWDEMTDAERHEALKANRCEAWDAVFEALVSGDASRTDEVLRALSGKPAIPDAARQTAYWHGYYLGQMEAVTKPEESTIDMVVAAYKAPELMALVREGYDDAKAGRPQKYGLPDPGALQQLMPAPGMLPGAP